MIIMMALLVRRALGAMGLTLATMATIAMISLFAPTRTKGSPGCVRKGPRKESTPPITVEHRIKMNADRNMQANAGGEPSPKKTEGNGGPAERDGRTSLPEFIKSGLSAVIRPFAFVDHAMFG